MLDPDGPVLVDVLPPGPARLTLIEGQPTILPLDTAWHHFPKLRTPPSAAALHYEYFAQNTIRHLECHSPLRHPNFPTDSLRPHGQEIAA